MKYLVIGLGSMGKRRIRNLQALNERDVAGFDLRLDRREEAAELYGIKVFDDISEAISSFKPDAFMISTSPDVHMEYAYLACENSINCFIEASVVEVEKIRELIDISAAKKVVMAPSCTMRYFPGPKKIKELLAKNIIGNVLNFNYQTGQYLPDWHPWEDIADYYVSIRETGAAREIIPFEMTWLNNIFGDPIPLSCFKTKVTDMDADIDDIYHLLLKYPNSVIGNLTIEVVSRPRATREMRILGSVGEIVFSADDNVVRYINTEMEDWVEFRFDKGTVENQYINPEEPYIAEVKDFVNSVTNNNSELFPNSLADDVRILDILVELEKIAI